MDRLGCWGFIPGLGGLALGWSRLKGLSCVWCSPRSDPSSYAGRLESEAAVSWGGLLLAWRRETRTGSPSYALRIRGHDGIHSHGRISSGSGNKLGHRSSRPAPSSYNLRSLTAARSGPQVGPEIGGRSYPPYNPQGNLTCPTGLAPQESWPSPMTFQHLRLKGAHEPAGHPRFTLAGLAVDLPPSWSGF